MAEQANSTVINGRVPEQKIEESQSELSSNLSSPNLLAISAAPGDSTSSKRAEVNNNWSLATFELLDALPRVWTRGLLYFLVVFISLVLPWAMLFKIDETGKARGRLEPDGNIFSLDSPVTAKVTAIRVKEGEKVKAGQELVILESSIVRQKLEQQESLLKAQENRFVQLELRQQQLEQTLSTQQQKNQAQLSEKQAQVREAQQQFSSLQQIHDWQKQQHKSLVEQAFIEVNSSKKARNLVLIQLQGATEKLTRYTNAYSQGIISQDRFEEVRQSVKENQERLLSAESDIALAQSRLKESQSNYHKLLEENQSKIQQASLRYEREKEGYSATISSAKLALFKIEEQRENLNRENTEILAEIEQTKSEIKSLLFQLEQRIIKAPTDGTVFELSMPKAGVVVQTGEKIAEIAPLGSSLILRGSITTTESGSLETGMPVKLKFDAYPFQDYGTVEGRLIKISPNSKVLDAEGGKIETYQLEIELDSSCIIKFSDCIDLRPGDTASAEIIVRQRRLIDLVIQPFKKLSHGSLEL